MNNREKAIEAFKQFTLALKNKSIKIYQSSLFSDLYVHIDSPRNKPRFTYFMLDPIHNEVIAQSIIIFYKRTANNKQWQIGWCVKEAYKERGIGYDLANKALTEFTHQLKHKIIGDSIEANIDKNNLPSIKIAKKLALELKDYNENSLTFIKLFS